MTQRKPLATALLLAAAIAPLAGCTSVLKQAYYEVRGAKAKAVPVDERGGTLDRFQSITFEPASTIIGPKVTPPALLRAYDDATRRLAADLQKDAYPGGEPTLTVRSDMLYAQTKGLMSGALCLTRVRLTGSDGTNLDVLLKAESKSFREGGESDLADAAVQALGKVLRDRKAPVDAD